jgi:hypothetical protein
MSDTSAVIGTTAAFHLSAVRVKIVYPLATKTGSYHVALDAHPAVVNYLSRHSLVQISGNIVASIVGPASADIVVAACASIVPTRVTSWPDTVVKVAEDANSQNFATSALSTIPTATLIFHPDINTTIKPRPQSGDHPALVVSWSVQTSAPVPPVGTRLEVVVPIQFSGTSWVQPASW